MNAAHSKTIKRPAFSPKTPKSRPQSRPGALKARLKAPSLTFLSPWLSLVAWSISTLSAWPHRLRKWCDSREWKRPAASTSERYSGASVNLVAIVTLVRKFSKHDKNNKRLVSIFRRDCG